MHNAYGHLEGLVIEVENDKGHTQFAVLAKNGIECYVSDIYVDIRPFPIEVGMKILLEEAVVMFENGRIVYCVDQKLRGVAINDVCLEHYMK